MKTNTHFLSHLAQLFLEWEMFQTKVVEKIKTHIWYSLTLFRNSFRFWDNVVKFCIGGQAIGDNIIWHLSFACWINKAIDTHSEYIILTAFFSRGTVATRKHLDVRLEINCKLMGRVIPAHVIYDEVVSCLTAEKPFITGICYIRI